MSTTAATATATATVTAIKAKAKRSPAITTRMGLEVIQLLLWEGVSDNGEPNSVSNHDIARWFNSHEYDASRPCSEWKEAATPGTRPGSSIYQWLNAKRKEVGDLKPENGDISVESKEYIESILDCVETSEAKETDFDDIVGGLKSLGFLRVPSNMVQGGSHKGTNGQPVDKELVDTYRLKPE